MLDLPIEIIHQFLLYLEPIEIITSREVCKLLKSIIDGSADLQYIIELYADHLVPGRSSLASVADELSALKRSREAWDNLTPTQEEYIELKGPYLTYEVRGGFYVHGTPKGGPLTGVLDFIELPASTPLTNRSRFSRVLGVDCSDFNVDPIQDLLVLLQVVEDFGSYIHLRTISTNEDHPLAFRQEAGTYLFTESWGFGNNSAIHDDQFALQTFTSRTTSTVTWWNWKTGDRIYFLDMGENAAFLSRNVLCVLCHNTGDIPLAYLIVISCEGNGGKLNVTHLSFPEPADDVDMQPDMYDGLRAVPRQAIATSPISSDRPYSIDHTSDLLVINFCVGDNFTNYLVFLRKSTLLRKVEQIQAIEKDAFCEWRYWGPDISRWIIPPDNSMWVCCTYGLRYVSKANASYAKQHWGDAEVDIDMDEVPTLDHLLVFDFNPTTIARGAKPFSSDTSDCFVVTSESRIIDWFEEEVVSRMPFRVIITKQPVDLPAVVMDCQSIIGLDKESGENDDGPLKGLRIMTF